LTDPDKILALADAARTQRLSRWLIKNWRRRDWRAPESGWGFASERKLTMALVRWTRWRDDTRRRRVRERLSALDAEYADLTPSPRRWRPSAARLSGRRSAPDVHRA
jgi:hypothetical protein